MGLNVKIKPDTFQIKWGVFGNFSDTRGEKRLAVYYDKTFEIFYKEFQRAYNFCQNLIECGYTNDVLSSTPKLQNLSLDELKMLVEGKEGVLK